MKTPILLLLLPLLTQTVSAGPQPGELVSWGGNRAGQAQGNSDETKGPRLEVVKSVGEPLRDVVAVATASSHSLALRSDGTVTGWGDNQMGRATGTQPPDSKGRIVVGNSELNEVIGVAAGGAFSLALKSNGTVISWGANKVPTGLTNAVAIAARGFYCSALIKDGTVVSWGSTPWSRTHLPPGLSNVVAVSVGGRDHERSLALKNDRTVVAWGEETVFGDMAPPAGLINVVAIAAGYNHSLALKDDGTVLGWGFNGGGQATGIPTQADPKISSGLVTVVGQILSNVVAIAAGDQYSLALKSDGKVVAWGDKRFYPQVPADLTNAVAIAAGDGFCLAIRRD